MVTTVSSAVKRHQFAEPPDAGEVEREAAVVPALFEVFEPLGDVGFVPVVADIEEFPAFGAGGEGLGDLVGGVRRGGSCNVGGRSFS